MLDIKFIRENADLVKTATKNKGFDATVVDKLLEIDKERRKLIQETEEIRAKKNKLTKDDIEEGKKLKIELKELEEKLKMAELEYEKLLWLVPNVPSSKSPVGKNDSENVEIKKWGTPRIFDFEAKDHVELGNNLGILNFEVGAKVAGSQFYFLYGDGALLELALTHYVFDKLSKKGFLPVMTPDLAKSRYYLGTGYAPKGDEAQTYTIEGQDLGLIATAEVTLAGSHADEVIPEEKLPIKYIGYSHCFRQEAGAYGKYSKGLYRVHQFSKTEMFVYCKPEDSERIHEELLAIEEEIYQELELPYRVLEMCTGDLGAMAARKFDVEVWMPGRNDYGEVTSTSNCTDFQARNLNIKYKKKSGETDFVHMLNGTAVVMSRVPVAILENYQNEDGSVTIPTVLQKWMGKEKIVLR
ncbi:MAG: serine--tRNA ligase [Microgenomates group bacterium]